MKAFKRTAQGPRIRSGVEFFEDRWVLVEDPTDAQLNDPGLLSMDVSGPEDPMLGNLEVRIAEEPPKPDEPKPLDPEAVNKYVDDQGGVIVLQADLDELRGKADRLETQLSQVEGDLTAEKNARADDKQKHADALTKLRADHKAAIDGLKEKHQKELEAANAEIKRLKDAPKDAEAAHKDQVEKLAEAKKDQ